MLRLEERGNGMADELTRKARELVAAQRSGVLCTNSTHKAGFAFGSLTPYAVDGAGRPIFLISDMGVHTGNLQADPRATLFVNAPAENGDPLANARVNVFGRVVRLKGGEAEEARSGYLTAHPEAQEWADFGDFAFYRLEPEDAYYIGGFGVMGWVESFA
jgi:heme iron utilization protein